MTGPPLLQASGLARWYGQVIALRDVSLQLQPGTTGLLGPNGAGKSTLLRIIAGLSRPSRGTLRLFGEEITSRTGPPPLIRRRLGYCPEHEGTYEELSGLEFVTLLTELQGFSPMEARRRAAAVLVELDLERAMHRPLGGYSKGMRQRAKLAQALAHDPELLILDEPLTGCDPLSRARVLDVLQARAERGTAVLFSSHVLSEIEALTSRIVVLSRGQIVAEGDVHAIRALIDRHPHAIRIECDDPRALGRALLSHPVSELRFEARALVIETRDPDQLYAAIPKAAAGLGIEVASLTSPDDNMEAVFRYLTESTP
jgi:ABC-2 type transport system ATP-binding protein